MMRRSKNRRGERGAELVEASVGLVVFLVLLLGIMDFGRAVYEYHFVSSAARQAARWASVRGSTCTGLSGGCPATSSNVQTYIRNTLAVGGSTGYDAGNITATTTWPKNPTNCPASGPANAPLCDVQVVVNYNFSFVTLAHAHKSFLGGLPTSFTMSSTSDMVISQ